MQSRYLLALCAFALIVAVVSAQQSGQPQESIIQKLKEEAEKVIRESFQGAEAAVQCVKEAGEHCKNKSVIEFIACSIQYLKVNKEKCKQNAQ